MAEQAVPPIVIDDHGDLALYATVEAASMDMEAIDVLDDVYEAFDSHARRLSLEVREGLVSIRLDPQFVPQPDELLRRLRHFIAPVGADRVGVDNVNTVSLDGAIRALARFFHVR